MKKLLRKLIMWALENEQLKATVFMIGSEQPTNTIVFKGNNGSKSKVAQTNDKIQIKANHIKLNGYAAKQELDELTCRIVENEERLTILESKVNKPKAKKSTKNKESE